MTMIQTEARFHIPDAKAIIQALCKHFEPLGVDVRRGGEGLDLTFDHWGRCRIAVDGEIASLTVASPTSTGVAVVREEIAAYLIDRVPDLGEKIVWSAADDEAQHPVWFCILTVKSTRLLTPGMKRITFLGADLDRYIGFDDIHMRLMFPLNAGEPPQWPTVGANGVTRYPTEEYLSIRRYTFRQIDVEAGTIDVDFVLHGDSGPGSKFAEHAQPGDVIGMGGPGGGSVPLDRDFYLLAGDETALPAIARILETLPDAAHGVALIEVADHLEEQRLTSPPGVAVRWLHRSDVLSGQSPSLVDAVRSTNLPDQKGRAFVWIGCEFGPFKELRSHVRKNRLFGKGDTHIVSYWKRGEGGNEGY